jgi:DNA-binding NarL/FixJ family response regulator
MKRMPAYYLTTDLFFSSRVLGVAKSAGWDLQTVGTLAALKERLTGADACPLVLIDLTLPKLELDRTVAAVRERFPAARIVAYGPHVQEFALAAAAAAGCDEVLSRGQLDRSLPSFFPAQ